MVSPRIQDGWPISDPRSQSEQGTLPKISLRWFYWVIFKPTLWWLGYQLRYLWRLVKLYWVVRVSNIRQYRIKKKKPQAEFKTSKEGKAAFEEGKCSAVFTNPLWLCFLGEFPISPERENIKKYPGPGSVVHACNPSHRVVKGRKIRS